MDDDRVYAKLDKIEEHVAEIKTTLLRNTDSLVAHMARTAIIEKALFPIKRLYDFGVVACQIIAILGVAGAAVEGAVALLTFIRK